MISKCGTPPAALLVVGIAPGQSACVSSAQCQGWFLVQVVYTPSVCGNGILEAGEGCDNGDLEGGDGCSATCQVCFAGETQLSGSQWQA